MQSKLKNLYKINSLLFVPAIKEKFYNKIFNFGDNSKPDGIIFDLEDSVHPNSKENAREILSKFIGQPSNRERLSEKYLFLVRVNSINSDFFKDDIRLVNKIKPDILMLSKVETADEIKTYKKYHKQIFVVVETLKGISNLQKILKEMRKTDLFALGYEDLSAELAIERPAKLNSINPLTHILLDSIINSRRFNLLIIDAVSRLFKTHSDLLRLKNECEYTAKLGLTGKVAIHPNQVNIINNIFSTHKKRMEQRSSNIITDFDRLADGSFVLVDEKNQAIDTPSYKLAKKIKKRV